MHRRTALRFISGALGSACVMPGIGHAEQTPELIHVPVSDGAVIGLEAAGQGPSLLLVHGSGTSRRSWARVTPLLQSNFRTYAMDRRGRGESTDGPTYSLQREVQDIAEVGAALPAPVFVVGHSIGAIMTLEALRLTDRFQKAVLYEPPLPVAGGMEGGSPEAVCKAVAAGDNDKAMTVFFTDYVMMPPPTVAAFKRDPSWPQRIKLAPTVCREARAHFIYRFHPDKFSSMATPTLVLLGGDSPKPMAVSTRAAAAALPHARLELLPGQQHVATQMAPDMLAHDISTFLIS